MENYPRINDPKEKSAFSLKQYSKVFDLEHICFYLTYKDAINREYKSKLKYKKIPKINNIKPKQSDLQIRFIPSSYKMEVDGNEVISNPIAKTEKEFWDFLE
jgi:predicted GIY-YIG superfamily endonuclease